MNEVIKTMEERRSVRAYKPDHVAPELIDQILEAGSYAANGMGRQPVIVLAVTDKTLRDKLSRMNAAVMGRDGDPFYGAPAVLVVLADKNSMTHVYDGALVMGNMMNAAASLGVASCWIHRAKETFESEEGKQILKDLGIEGDYEGIGNLIIGYADGEVKPAAPRKEKFAYRV